MLFAKNISRMRNALKEQNQTLLLTYFTGSSLKITKISLTEDAVKNMRVVLGGVGSRIIISHRKLFS